MLDELILHAKKLGITKLVLDVSKNNPRAIRFYEKNGFMPTTVEPRDDWPESKEPETHMYFYLEVQDVKLE